MTDLIETIYRQSVLRISGAPPVERFLRSQGFKLGVGRFVAGETLDEALRAVGDLEREGLRGILDLLGEFVDTRDGVETMKTEILRTLDVLSSRPIDRYMSVKPTQLGLGIDLDTALGNVRQVAERARAVGAHICLDMENHPFVDGTLAIYRTLHGEGYRNLSTVLQSYLKRSPADLEALLELEPRPILRIVKGAYREPPSVAFQDKRKVDQAFRDLVYRTIEAGAHVNIATHDESIIRETTAFVRGAGLGPDRYEFQLLYGVKPALQRELNASGHLVRIYVPYGSDWYGYFSRRLAERPANLAFVLRGLVG